jgi:hypothetical protein
MGVNKNETQNLGKRYKLPCLSSEKLSYQSKRFQDGPVVDFFSCQDWMTNTYQQVDTLSNHTTNLLIVTTIIMILPLFL